MKKLKLITALVCVMTLAFSCDVLKSINYVTVCAEPGTIVELSRYGKYKVNNKEVTKKEADSLCLSISFKQYKNR